MILRKSLKSSTIILFASNILKELAAHQITSKLLLKSNQKLNLELLR